MIALSDRLKSVGEYYFSRKLEQIRKMNQSGAAVINLGIGSPDQLPPEPAIEAAALALHSKKSHGYSPYRGSPELRAAMAEWYQATYGVTLNSETEVLPLLGSKEGIFYLSMAYLNPGDSVLVPNPGYPAYSAAASLLGARVVHYELSEAGGWLPDLRDLEKRIDSQTKIFWVNYPHMPTGAQANPEFFRKLVSFAKAKGILLCNDNPYGLVLNREPPLSLLSEDAGMENCAELNSLSKSFNMAGWRVGMLLGSAAVVDATIQAKSNVDSGMFSAVQSGAIAALRSSQAWHERRNRVYLERREIVWRIFERLGFQFDRNQVGLFVWARVRDEISDVGQWVDAVLDQARVFLTPGAVFGSAGARYVRASLCAELESLLEAERRMERLR